MAAKQEVARKSCTLYVGGIPINATERNREMLSSPLIAFAFCRMEKHLVGPLDDVR